MSASSQRIVAALVHAECGHAYRTPGELRSAYRRTVLAVPAAGVPWWWRWWRAATARATQIDCCPHCGATL